MCLRQGIRLRIESANSSEAKVSGLDHILHDEDHVAGDILGQKIRYHLNDISPERLHNLEPQFELLNFSRVIFLGL